MIPESEIMSYLIENEFVIAFAITSLIISVIALFFAKPLERKSFKSDAMLALFKIMNGENIKKHKKILADRWHILKETDKDGKPTNDVKAKFENFPIETRNVMEAYNNVGALYELNLIDKKHFRKVYGGNFVRTYNFSIDHIEWRRGIGSEEYCLHFKNIALELMKDGLFRKGIIADVYNDKSTA